MHAIMLQDDSMPMTLHEGAFAVVVESQGSDEQRALWMPRIARYEVTGCYAQTELAHGSNVQGLETTAVFDRATQEFVVNSPRIESTKWWIGGLGIMVLPSLCYLRLFGALAWLFPCWYLRHACVRTARQIMR